MASNSEDKYLLKRITSERCRNIYVTKKVIKRQVNIFNLVVDFFFVCPFALLVGRERDGMLL